MSNQKYEPLNTYKESEQEVDFSRNYSTISSDGDVEIIFRNIKQYLIDRLNNLPDNWAVIGCVAWLTDPDILRALFKKCIGVTIQKEEFLRPDKIQPTKADFLEWSKMLLKLYEEAVKFKALPMHYPKFEFTTRLDELTGYQHAEAGDFRCIGYAAPNRTERSTIPLMHHKFLVIVEIRKEMQPVKYGQPKETEVLRPKMVWTGSYNMSANASDSLENAVIMKDPKILQAYCQEWANLYFNSERLDWQDEYFYPNDDFRVHT
jgi:hypothetical protein